MKFNKKISSQPRKTRKTMHNANRNTKHIMMSCRLSTELRAMAKRKTYPVIRESQVIIQTGPFARKAAEVVKVSYKKGIVYVREVTSQQSAEAPAVIGIHPSNLLMTKFSPLTKLSEYVE